ncbi:hypothetical protein SJA_C1-20810 [Sphingobium indicum UT26S]|uniref:Uncharacterized protein n=1 Tax=Sphingobium indicum (strain DSM 16413 / CCM 7287 / MTCC 6362 / UT26 / NBRC 101211 / UT26S) TaxID=452662 RepID=D4Z2T3_SPHIU|nr:hypothetical protein SJA_C1-20810 [Sphingobium indicum UT26S]
MIAATCSCEGRSPVATSELGSCLRRSTLLIFDRKPSRKKASPEMSGKA